MKTNETNMKSSIPCLVIGQTLLHHGPFAAKSCGTGLLQPDRCEARRQQGRLLVISSSFWILT